MTRDLCFRQVIKAGPSERGVSKRKAAWLYDVDWHAHACSHANDSSGIGSYIGLKERNSH
jgi:hypothetical protein